MKKIYMVITDFEGKVYTPVARATERGANSYAHQVFGKFYERYGKDRTEKGLTVYYGYYDENLHWVDCMVYHA